MNHQPDPIEIAAAITLDTIRDAAARISGHIVRTPLLESPRLNDALGFRLLVSQNVCNIQGRLNCGAQPMQ